MHAPVITFVVRTVVGSTLRRPWPLFVAVCWCIASAAAAQSALTGIVHDPSGRVAVGAKVTVIDVKAPQQWETHATALGYYEIELPAGEYRVEASLGGLTFSGTIQVLPQEKAAFDIELQVARRQELVTVESTSAAGDAFGPSGATSATFTQEDISTRPLQNGRTIQSLQSLVPGIVFTDSNGSQAQFTAAGQRRFSNRLTIDGVSADLGIDIGNLGISEGETGSLPAMSTMGSTLTIVPMLAIGEMQVKTTDTSPAEARAPGAQTIIVTRAGSDRFAGDAFTDIRPEGLGAQDWFSTAVTPVSTTKKGRASSVNSGASAGGPVVPQRLFYFAAWEGQRVTRPVSATGLVPSLATRENATENLKPLFNAFPVPNGPEATGPYTGLAQLSADYPAVSTLSSVFLRLDANLATNHRLFGRANFGRSRGDWLDTTQIPATSYDSIESTRTKTGMLGLTSAFSSSLTNEARFSVSTNGGWLSAGKSSHVPSAEFPRNVFLPEDTSLLPVATGVSPWVNIAAPAFGASISSGSRTGNTQELLQVADTLSLNRGRHEFRVGVDARWQTSSTDPAPEIYGYRFNQVAAFFQGGATLTLTNNSAARVRFTRVALFAEDSFRVSKRFSLGYGVRYNIEPAPSNLDSLLPLIFDADTLSDPEGPQERPAGAVWKTQWSNIAPRVAATYQFGTGTAHETTFRALWNLSFDELTAASANVFGSTYPYVSRRVALVSTFPVSPSVLDTPEPTRFSPTDRNTYYASPDTFRTPKTYGWQLGFDQALGNVQRLSVAYAGAAGRDQSYAYSSSVASLPHVARVNAFSNDAQSDYHALLAEYVWRLSHGLQAQVSYTWSHAIDIDSGETVLTVKPNPPPDRLSPNDGRGSADFDRRHVLQTVASYQLPRLTGSGLLRTVGTDWQVDASLALRSGAPFTVISTRDIGFGVFPFRADAVPGVSPWVADRSAPGGQRLDASAFLSPPESRQGTLGRNTLRASPLRQVDLGLSRVIRAGDRVTTRLRLEVFNVFNVPNFGPPLADLQTPQLFGRPLSSYASTLGTGTLLGGGLAPIQQVGGPRSVQIGMRVTF